MAGMLAALLVIGVASAAAQEITGYRSARFSMAESEVLNAIGADFGVAPDAVARSVHALEKTTILTVLIDNLVYGSGRTEIAYILGYRSKALIQVNLVWRQPSDTAENTERLVSAANVMINRIALQGVPRDEIQPNTALENGAILLFRGRDKRGRLVLIGLKRPSASDDSRSTAASDNEGSWLRVSFIDNADAPDIFKIEPGQF